MRPVRQLKPWKVGADQPDAEAGGDQVLEAPASPLSPMRVNPGRIASVRRACTSNAAATSRFPIFGLCWKTGWETALQAVAEARAELARRQALRPKTLTSAERAAILALGDDLHQVWDDLPPPARTASNYCTPLLDEVNITVHRDRSQGHADLVLRWKGATLSELTTPPSASHQRSAPMRTPSAGRRLTAHYPDAKIAWILNWQGRRPAWHGREIPLEPARWPLIADGAPTPHQHAEARDLLAALREDSGSRLTAHQREVLVAIALSDVPIDVLAERLNTTRGALYKTPHDARQKLRAALAARGLGIDGDERGEEP